ncbi:hypothetical protein AF72_12180 [Xylella taiwanensis]|uniref:Uncharacterized protein n=1 Tax=Xylella taiwanensis TaxID=1444770 RepID=Z9JFK1_9GAMM|nr:hypothetical protein AF72_12180 [Xylella taiwanensis]
MQSFCTSWSKLGEGLLHIGVVQLEIGVSPDVLLGRENITMWVMVARNVAMTAWT